MADIFKTYLAVSVKLHPNMDENFNFNILFNIFNTYLAAYVKQNMDENYDMSSALTTHM